MSDELTILKERADKMGIKYHPAIGADKLAAKINEVLEGEEPEAEEVVEAVSAPTTESPQKRKLRLRKEATKLIRIRVTCMNPNKKEWQGEIFTFANSVVGTVKKYVPFNAEDGWHVPNCIYKQILDRQCQVFQSVKTERGVTVRKGKLIKEFAVEVLPPLTAEELAELGRVQAMGKNIEG